MRRWSLRTVFSVAAAVAGLILLAAAAMIRDRSLPTNFGATAAPVVEVSGTFIPSIAPPSSTDPASTSSRSSGKPSRPGATPLPAPPAQVTIVKLGVRAPVVPVLARYGQLDVPTDPARLGWWPASARVGALTGTVLIDGHVDAAGFGPGTLFRLNDLNTSDRITVTATTGYRQEYTVIGRRVYVKTDGLPPELFATTGPARLVLITCGGPFDRTTLNYRDNIVIYAVPITVNNS
jgi:hypothetical protein